MSTATVTCPGCTRWRLSWDASALQAELDAPLAIVNGAVSPIRASDLIEAILCDHVLDCPPVQGWLARRGRSWRRGIAATHPRAVGRSRAARMSA